MKNLFFILISSVLVKPIISQTVFLNNGQDIVFNNEVDFIVKNGDFSNDDGYIKNEGNVHIEGSYINNAVTDGGNPNSSFFVLNHWENNASFNANNSTVVLNGTDQNIEGIAESHFFNLTFENLGIKTMFINSSVSSIFKLNTSELATTYYKMFLLNPDVNSLEFIENTGFVSSTDNGRFVRNTNSLNSYIFPTGENIGTLKYRPISIKPNSLVSQQFEVRFANTSADLDGYDYELKSSQIKSFNDNFYHLINQSNGNEDVDLSVFYNESEDGNWKSIAQWNSMWYNLGGEQSSSSLSKITYNNWISNNDEAHILVNLKECKLAVPTGFSPDGNNYNDNFYALQSCDFETFALSIFNRWGELIFESNEISSSWNGTYKGLKANVGVYSWIVNYKLKGSKDTKLEKGTITLLR